MPVKVQRGAKAAYPMQFCPVIKQISLLRKKWMLPLLLELFSAKKTRFSGLQRALQPITPKLLTQRLADLEKEGFIAKSRLKHNEVEYHLTPKIETLRGLVSFIKKDCMKKSSAAKAQCESCKESHRCFLAYGI